MTIAHIARLLLPVLLLAPSLAAAQPELGRVSAVRGEVYAEREGEPPRRLACRDPILAGDRVVTSDGSRVGFLMGELFTHVAEGSALRVDEGSGAASLTLERGATRVIDARDSGAQARLKVLSTQADVQGNDLEGYVFSEKMGPYAMLCEWDDPLRVQRGPDEALLAQPGQCVLSKQREPLYLAEAHSERLGPIDADACAPTALIGDLGAQLSPADVAAGPMLGPWSSVPSAVDSVLRQPCDMPGSGCILASELPPVGGGPIFP